MASNDSGTLNDATPTPVEGAAAPRADDLATLAARGDLSSLAHAYLAAGQPNLAAECFEKIWDFEQAHQAWLAARQFDRALAMALAGKRDDLARACAAQLAAHPNGYAQAMGLITRARHHSLAAELAEAAGDFRAAATQYHAAHRDLDAARVYELLGDEQRAGQLLEALVQTETSPDYPAATLRLGALLFRRQMFTAALGWLQAAARHAAHREAALTLSIRAFANLGMMDAAADVLRQLRLEVPTAPASVEAVMNLNASPADGTNSASRLLGRYELKRLLGVGGIGNVYLADDLLTNREVAIKTLQARNHADPRAMQRWAREADIARALQHPNVVEIYAVHPEAGLLVMEYLPGGTLSERLGAGKAWPEAAVRRLGIELCAALEAAHHAGVIHRDIKPSNILFSSNDSAKLADFGVAHLASSGQTQTGAFIGTLAFMAPEQLTGAPLHVTADLYALGVVLYLALTGRLPFAGPDFVAQHLSERPSLPSTLVPVAQPWDDLIEQLLAKAPAERPSSAAEVGQRLRAMELVGPRVPRLPALDHATPAGVARYQPLCDLPSTSISTLHLAMDLALGRQVVQERFSPAARATAVASLRHVTPITSPYVQRVLALHEDEGLVMYEAPRGRPLAHEPLAKPDAAPLAWVRLARISKRLIRALLLLPPNASAWPWLQPDTIWLDDDDQPMLLLSGQAHRIASATEPPTSGEAPPLHAQLLRVLTPWLVQHRPPIDFADAPTLPGLFRAADELEALALLQAAPPAGR